MSSFSESDLRRGSLVQQTAAAIKAKEAFDSNSSSRHADVKGLTEKTARMKVDSPAANTRSRSVSVKSFMIF